MSDETEQYPTELWITSTLRTLIQKGLGAYVIKKGASTSGSVLLRINCLNGFSKLLTQVRDDDKIAWCPVFKTEKVEDAKIEAYILQQSGLDPDLWIIEIEDKNGHHWFEGKILDL